MLLTVGHHDIEAIRSIVHEHDGGGVTPNDTPDLLDGQLADFVDLQGGRKTLGCLVEQGNLLVGIESLGHQGALFQLTVGQAGEQRCHGGCLRTALYPSERLISQENRMSFRHVRIKCSRHPRARGVQNPHLARSELA